jgi:hypothetical protein
LWQLASQAFPHSLYLVYCSVVSWTCLLQQLTIEILPQNLSFSFLLLAWCVLSWVKQPLKPKAEREQELLYKQQQQAFNNNWDQYPCNWLLSHQLASLCKAVSCWPMWWLHMQTGWHWLLFASLDMSHYDVHLVCKKENGSYLSWKGG